MGAMADPSARADAAIRPHASASVRGWAFDARPATIVGCVTRIHSRALLAFVAFSILCSSRLANADPILSEGRHQAIERVDRNKEVVRRFLLGIAAQDARAMTSALTPNAHLVFEIAGVYSPELRAFPGGTQWEGKDIVDMELSAGARHGEPSRLDILSMIGEDNLVAAEVIASGTNAANGRAYCQHYSYHFQVADGRISEARVYQDTFHEWDVWNNLGPQVRPLRKAMDCVERQTTSVPVETDRQSNGVAANKETVRRFIMSVPARDTEAVREAWAADGAWSFAVGGGYSRDLHAFQDAPRWTRDQMISMQQAGQRNLREPYTVDIYSIIGEGDKVSAETVGFLVRADGRAYRQHYSLHFVLRYGKIVEGHVYQDTLHQYDLSVDRNHEYAPVSVETSLR